MDKYVLLELLQEFMKLHPSEGLFDVLPVFPWNKNLQKNHESSERCRVFGNMGFKKGEFEVALQYYNASLCYAPKESDNIPLVYGNRSAVYCEMGKYALAIENIELARKNGYPAEKMAQLNAREEKSKNKIEEAGPISSSVADSFFKLSHPPNEKIPFIAGCLEFKKTGRTVCFEKGGRGVVTNKDLKAGDIVAIEEPVFTWINEMIMDPACFFCTKSVNGNLIPCSHCPSVMFCSEECQAKAALFHINNEKNGAYDGEKFGKCLKMQLEAYRIAGGVDEALELLKDSAGKTIFDFDFSDPDDPAYEKNTLIALNGLWKNPECLEIMKTNPNQLLNIPPINEKPRTAEERRRLLQFIYGQCQILCLNFIQFNRHHHGIYLLQALINYHCEPNVLSVKFGEKSVLIVTRPIKAGNQLLNGCTKLWKLQAKTERLLMVKNLKNPIDATPNDWPEHYRKKDRRFVEPRYEKMEPAAAVEQFKKNCQYINKNDKKKQTYEIERLVDHNVFLAYTIADGKIHQLVHDFF